MGQLCIVDLAEPSWTTSGRGFTRRRINEVQGSLGVGRNGILEIPRLERGVAFVFPLPLFRHTRSKSKDVLVSELPYSSTIRRSALSSTPLLWCINSSMAFV